MFPVIYAQRTKQRARVFFPFDLSNVFILASGRSETASYIILSDSRTSNVARLFFYIILIIRSKRRTIYVRARNLR